MCCCLQVARQGSLAEQQLHQQQLQALHDDLQAVRVSISGSYDVLQVLPLEDGLMGCLHVRFLVVLIVQQHQIKLPCPRGLLPRPYVLQCCLLIPMRTLFECCCKC